MTELGKTGAPPRWPFVVALVLCLAGIGVTIQLTNIHYFTHTDPAYHSICAIDEQINCETVAESPYSVFLGLPVSIWGLIVYVVAAALCLWGLLPGRLHSGWPRGILFCIFTAGLFASAVLAYVSFVLIQSLCIFCLSLYGLNLLLIGTAIAALASARRGPLGALIDDLRRPLGPILVTVSAAAVAAGLVLLLPPYWVHPGWRDLPELPTGVTADGQHWIGAKDAVIDVVEYSDYQCPHCRRAHKNMRATTAVFSDTVRLVHHHMPVDHHCNPEVEKPFHERACELAAAVECAADQGAFWKMNDAVFSIQDQVSAADIDLEQLASQIGLDVDAFAACVKAGVVMGRIRKDLRAARKLSIPGTPTYFIHSQPYPGGIPEGIVRRAVDSALERRAEGKTD
ncbi:MAG: thioredoxin domain-containing protein [Deltaproteobacteria bacterium]|nr:thioredoxin domain-containing protein [Deltaproteobacteria bacterium]